MTLPHDDVETGLGPLRTVPTGWSYRPRVDVTENADGFVISADMPGSSPDAVDVSFENRTLMIRGAVPARQVRGTEYLLHEYGLGDFDRHLVLPDTVDPSSIDAVYVGGVLTIRIPKTAAAKPRQIPVRTTPAISQKGSLP